MYAKGGFDLSCKDDLWLGRGTFVSDGERIVFDFEGLTHRKGENERRQVTMAFEGRGNTLRTEVGEWRRVFR